MPTSPFDVNHFDYSPWFFWDHADDVAKERQVGLQQQLMADEPGTRIAERCFISEIAAVQTDRLELGYSSYIAGHAYVTGTLVTGTNCTINPFTVVRGEITLGNAVRIGAHTSILAFNHTMDDPDTWVFKQPLTSKGISIGDDVWIGSHVMIVDGITVGDRAMIAAGSVVTKDVPAGAVVAGNPARVKRWRVAPDAPAGDLATRLVAFVDAARAESDAILARSWDPALAEGRYRDKPDGEASVRAHCDAIEIAAYLTGEAPAQLSADEHRSRLTALQDPSTGMIPPYGADGLPEQIELGVHNDQANYHVLCVGYALDLLGASFDYPISAVDDLGADELLRRIDAQPWRGEPWRSGHFADMIGTALLWNRRHAAPASAATSAALFGWLTANTDPRTGMWGTPGTADGDLQIVNGFYRTSRGSYAQFGVPLPRPRSVIDTVLTHAREDRFFARANQNACNVLDVAHPLWLARKDAPGYRDDEIRRVASVLLEDALTHWVPGEGFPFAAATDGPQRDAQRPGLQGTEMWLAIIWYLADLIGLSSVLEYRPRGIHRPEPAEILGA